MSQVYPSPSLPAIKTELVPLLVREKSGLRVSAEGFWRICCDNRDLRLERSARGELIVMSPAGSESGFFNGELCGQLWVWSRQNGTGIGFDSSAGFTLPNGAVRAPDAAWIRRDRWEAISPDERKRFAPICPDFVVELMSPSDSLNSTREKLEEYVENGTRLGWLIDPNTGNVEIYRPSRAVEELHRPASLSGEDVLPGFVLDLTEILLEDPSSSRND